MSHISPDRLADQLGNGDVTRVSTAAFSLVNALQNQQGLLPGESVGAVLAAFILTMEASGMNTADAIGKARNLMADANGRRPEFKAVTDYLKAEVLSS